MRIDSAELDCQRTRRSPSPVGRLVQQVQGLIGSYTSSSGEVLNMTTFRDACWGRTRDETRSRHARGLLLALCIQISTLS